MSGRGAPVGDRDVLVHGYRGFDASLGGRSRGDAAALAAHDEVLRSAIEAHGGWLFKHTGDGVCAAFRLSPAAVTAAVEAQRRLALPVRMGVATGEAELRDGDYFGPMLNRTARVMAAGHGGQVLVAAATAGLLSGVDLADLGEHRLRDLSGVEHLFQVRAEGLGEVFSPLADLGCACRGTCRCRRRASWAASRRSRRSSSWCGRIDGDLDGGGRGRQDPPGAAGRGGVDRRVRRRRVARRAGARRRPGRVARHGGHHAGRDPTAGDVGERERGAGAAGRRMLVVLDNCEHVLDAAAELVETILARAATVTVLATSREGLRVTARAVVAGAVTRRRAAGASAAVELFVDRARAVEPGFGLRSDADAAAVTEICRRLDGIPLAIELAAARMVSMSPQRSVDRLGDRFRLLAGARRGLERHQTLRHAVGWSYDLLDDDERAVLRQVAVFADGFDLAGAAHLNEALDEYTVLDTLDSLVRKSLVSADQVGGHTRYRLLETIRQYAEDQLAATGTIHEVRDRHAAYYAAAGRRPLGAVGRARPEGGPRLGRCRAGEPAGRVPLGRATETS